MAALWIIIRIVLFLAIVAPLVWWVVRMARRAHHIPTNHEDDQMLERARAVVHHRPFGR